MKKALFLDRDGTLILDRNYLADPDGVELTPGAAEALRRARERGYLLFLFTNQSGIGRGYHTLADTHRVHARMEELLGLDAPTFQEICIAPERPDQPPVYRKPSPRFIQEMVEKYGLNRDQCFMVGDSAGDILAAVRAGIRPILVSTGKLVPEAIPEARAHAVPVFASLMEFAATLE